MRFPLSLVRSRDGTLLDTALVEQPPLIGGSSLEYAPDWKPEFKQTVWPKFGWTSPKGELRVRTRIDSRVRRAAENHLFAHETILPHDEDGRSIEWYGYADFSAVPADKRDKAIGELHDLLQRFGLVLLGKTKASAQVELARHDLVLAAVESSRAPIQYPGREGAHWVVTLQSDAVLVPSEALSPSATAETLKAEYDKAWRNISGDRLCLVHDLYFAQQKLAGGEYLRRRFWNGNGRQEYRPLPLTEAGSVFVLAPIGPGKAAEKAAQAAIDDLVAGGLQLPHWAKKSYWPTMESEPSDWSKQSEAPLWRTLPYLRQNGFGEIAVNLATHSKGCAALLRLAAAATHGGAA